MAVVVIVHTRWARPTELAAMIVTPTSTGTWTQVGWRALESHELWVALRAARPQDRAQALI